MKKIGDKSLFMNDDSTNDSKELVLDFFLS